MSKIIVKRLRLFHLITSLDLGGAETVLLRLLKQMDRTQFEHDVVCLIHAGPISKEISSLGIRVRSLEMVPQRPTPRGYFQLLRLLRKSQPDILQTWMYHADLMGGIAARLTGKTPVVWGIRNSTLEPRYSNPRTLKLIRVNAKLANFLTEAIISNSKTAMAVHVGLGFPKSKFRIIPNGYDTEEFTPSLNAHSSLRNELNLPESSFLIGLIGRFDPQKDHKTFIEAAELFYQKRPDVHYIMAGKNVDWDNPILSKQINQSCLSENFRLLGPRKDIPQVMAGLNILTSVSTYGESFPNVVAEAMACGVPCVVTNVGDSAYIVEGSGKVVPVRNPSAVAQAWEEFLQLSKKERITISQAARNRIESKFGIKQMAESYSQLYLEIRDRKSRAQRT